MAGDRMRSINEAVRKAISSAISSELEDPRIGFVTVTAVDTTRDLRRARVYISVLGDEEARAETLAGLRAAHGVLQGAIAREARIKYTPTLTFVYDEGPERAARLARLLEEDS